MSPSTEEVTTTAQPALTADQIFRSYVNSWRNRATFRRPRPNIARTNGGDWFFLPLQLGPSPTRRPYSPS